MRIIGLLSLMCVFTSCAKSDSSHQAAHTPTTTAQAGAESSSPEAGESEPPSRLDADSPEARALAFFKAIQSGDPAAVKPFLLVPNDCDYMKQEIAKDGADLEKCHRGITKLHENIDQWLPRATQEFKALQPSGVVTIAKAEEAGAPKWAYKVAIAMKNEKPLRVIAAFKFENKYRFILGMKKSKP